MIRYICPKSQFSNTNNLFEGESIEREVERLTTEKRPIESVSPPIYTEAKDGVQPQYDIRTDRWEIAQEAMDAVAASYEAQRQNYWKQKEEPDNGTNVLSPLAGEPLHAAQQDNATPTE